MRSARAARCNHFSHPNMINSKSANVSSVGGSTALARQRPRRVDGTAPHQRGVPVPAGAHWQSGSLEWQCVRFDGRGVPLAGGSKISADSIPKGYYCSALAIPIPWPGGFLFEKFGAFFLAGAHSPCPTALSIKHLSQVLKHTLHPDLPLPPISSHFSIITSQTCADKLISDSKEIKSHVLLFDYCTFRSPNTPIGTLPTLAVLATPISDPPTDKRILSHASHFANSGVCRAAACARCCAHLGHSHRSPPLLRLQRARGRLGSCH